MDLMGANLYRREIEQQLDGDIASHLKRDGSWMVEMPGEAPNFGIALTDNTAPYVQDPKHASALTHFQPALLQSFSLELANLHRRKTCCTESAELLLAIQAQIRFDHERTPFPICLVKNVPHADPCPTPTSNSKMALKTVFDCFCGFGGMSLGAELAGLQILGGIDANDSAIEMFGKCFPEALPLQHDLLTEVPAKIFAAAGVARGDVDVLIGGPPCQPYSINNHRRSTEDSRCGLVQRYMEVVSTLKPKWLVMENVPAFISIGEGKFFKSLLRSLRGRGYTTDFGILEASNFGVPQRRRRLIVLACRDGSKVAPTMQKLLNHKMESVTVGEAIGDLPDLPSALASYTNQASCAFQKSMRRNASGTVQGHLGPTLQKCNMQRIKHVPVGGNWRDIPRKLLPLGMQRARLTDHTTRYGRLHPSKPAFTLLTKCDPHWGCFVHPRQDRVITVREAARLQSIPDTVEFHAGLTANYRLIGNAVPPLLAKSILEIIQ